MIPDFQPALSDLMQTSAQSPTRSRGNAVRMMLVCCLVSLVGCSNWQSPTGFSSLFDRMSPSNDRQWRPEFESTASIDVNGAKYSIRNIRNCNYVTKDDFVVDYYDRDILLGMIQSVDFIVVPFNNAPKLAHTMMSFGLDDGTYIAVSVEVRKELGEKYNPLLGMGRQYELAYVLSDERDVIRLRTRHQAADVYVYPTVASPKQAQLLFADIATRVNKLAVEPEFYHSLRNNCTTNLAGHVNTVSPNKINYGWKVLLPGLSAEYAYDLGLLDNRIPFEDLTAVALVNNLADIHFDDPDFSQLIRGRRDRLERYLSRQIQREPTLRTRGEASLDDFRTQQLGDALLGRRTR